MNVSLFLRVLECFWWPSHREGMFVAVVDRDGMFLQTWSM